MNSIALFKFGKDGDYEIVTISGYTSVLFYNAEGTIYLYSCRHRLKLSLHGTNRVVSDDNNEHRKE